MGRENKHRSTPEERAEAIAGMFLPVDQAYSRKQFDRTLGRFTRQFGNVDMSEIETTFRENGFNIHLLGIPKEAVKLINSSSRVVNINDLFTRKIHPRPKNYGFYVYPSLGELKTSVQKMKWEYNKDDNLARLRDAGMIVDHPIGSATRRRSAGTRRRRR